MTRIRIHIDRLVLDGFSPLEAHRIAEAIESELHSRFASGALAAGELPAHIDRVDAGQVTWNGFSSARSVGRRVAGAIGSGGEQ